MKLADLLSDMIASGADMAAVKAVVDSAKRQDEAKDQRRRDLTAARVAKHRASRNACNAGNALQALQPSPSPSSPPGPPSPPTPTPVVIPPEPSAPAPKGAAGKRAVKRQAEPEGFADWYAAYPEKVGRDTAAKAFGRVIQGGRATIPELHDGLERYKRTKPPDRAWRHPATFLNGGHWADEPAEPPLPMSHFGLKRTNADRPMKGGASAAAGVRALFDHLEGLNHEPAGQLTLVPNHAA